MGLRNLQKRSFRLTSERLGFVVERVIANDEYLMHSRSIRREGKMSWYLDDKPGIRMA